MFGIDIRVRYGKVEIVSMLKFEEMACEECQRLARAFRETYPFPVDPFFETSCSCSPCRKILQHLMEAHPDIIALVMLDEQTADCLASRQRNMKRGKARHPKPP